MQMSLQTELISALKELPIKRASLFGSFARGDNNEDSDIDILIDIEPSLSIFDVLRMEEILRKRFSRKIDLVEFSAIKPSIVERVLSQAIPLI
jgi:predicted nucleotidyltransferase